MSKAIPFPVSYLPRIRWVGFVNSWESRINPFTGKPKEVPFPVEFAVWASTAEEAEYRLSEATSAQGYALGGVYGVMPLEKAVKARKDAHVSSSTTARASKPKEAELDKLMRMCDPSVLAEIMKMAEA